MYSIYQIYQSDKVVYSIYHTMNNQYSDTTKLDIVLNSPVTPYYLVDGYFKQPELFTIKLVKDGISNALEANEILLKLINSSIDTVIEKKPNRTKKKKEILDNTTKS